MYLVKIDFLKIIKNLFRILKPFTDKSPDWGIWWENNKKQKIPMGYY
jgi:hypothetical protein